MAKLGAASAEIWCEFLEPPEGLLSLLQATKNVLYRLVFSCFFFIILFFY